MKEKNVAKAWAINQQRQLTTICIRVNTLKIIQSCTVEIPFDNFDVLNFEDSARIC